MLQVEYKDNEEVYDVRKIKADNKKKEQKAPMSKNTKISLYVLAGIALLVVVLLIVLEIRDSKITVRNDSDIKLEYVKAYFVDMEGRIFKEEMLFENIDKGDSSELLLDKINLLYREANLEIRFKLEGHDELFVDSGYFNDYFDGRISIDFKNADDNKLLLKIKASVGLVPTPNIRCDEEHLINLTEGYVEE